MLNLLKTATAAAFILLLGAILGVGIISDTHDLDRQIIEWKEDLRELLR